MGGSGRAWEGHENSRGLNNSKFLRLMRAGLLLDVTYGEASAAEALALAKQFGYPLMDSHTGIRDASDRYICRESVAGHRHRFI